MEGNIIFTQLTPNPLACKFVFDLQLAEGDESFETITDTNPGWVNDVLMIEGVRSVYIAHNFITVARKEGVEWFELDLIIKEKIKKATHTLHLGHKPTLEPSLQEIQAWLEKYIDPLTHQDGGVFEVSHIEKGILYLKPKGACYACPFVNMTIKKGIESNIKHYFPEIIEVRPATS